MVGSALEETFENGADPPDGDWALPMELPQYQFHVEEGQSAQQQHHDVRDEEGAWGESWRNSEYTAKLIKTHESLE